MTVEKSLGQLLVKVVLALEENLNISTAFHKLFVVLL